jgi:nicotinamidase/pyrazinamidase
MKPLKIERTDALLIVDLQTDFGPGGALPVQGGHDIVQPINSLARLFAGRGALVVATQDWHPTGHVSFASTFQVPAFTRLKNEMVWPDHCVQGTDGAALVAGLDTRPISLVLRKGTDPLVDSYSAFYDNARRSTGLADFLLARDVRRVFVCGLARDYCVAWTANDSARSLTRFAGGTFVLDDMTRSVNAESFGRITDELENEDVRCIDSSIVE